MVSVDLRQLSELLRFKRMMGDRVVRLRYSNLRIGPRAGLSSHLKGDNACDVGLKSEHLKVEHQLHVLFPVHGYTRGTLQFRQLRVRRLLLGLLDAALDLANRVDI